MKTCQNCGTNNDDSLDYCQNCGQWLDGSGYTERARIDVIPTSKPKIGRILLIVLGALLTLAAVTLALLFTLSPKLSLLRAGKSTYDLLPKALSKEGIQVSSSQPLQALAQGKASGAISFSGEGYSVETSFDYNEEEDLFSGDAEISFDEYGLSFGMDYSVDGTVFKLVIPAIGDEVYGMDLEEYVTSGAVDESLSPLGALFVDIPTDEATAFVRAVNVEKVGKSTVTTDKGDRKCRVYEISWNEDSAEKFEELLSESDGVSEIVSYLIEQAEAYDVRLLCYVNSGKILRLDVEVSGKTQYSLVLRGASNPWDCLDFTVYYANDTKDKFSIDSELESSTLRVVYSLNGEALATLTYDVETGSFSLFSEILSEELVSGRFVCTKDELSLAVHSLQGIDVNLELTITEFEAEHEAITGAYADIQNIDWSSLFAEAAADS